MIVDLRSDTVTKPSQAMLQAMIEATLGDDVFGEDPTVTRLEKMVAEKFGMEAAIFCPSGTMTNQIAIKAQTQPLDEIICDKLCHIYNYETGGWAFHSGVSIRLTDGMQGVMKPEMVEELILPDFDWLPNTRFLAIENTVNKGGGAVYDLDTMTSMAKVCRKHKLIYHMDGARIFNALIAKSYTPEMLHGLFDSISVCLSKGLGAPAGSVLAGSKEMIKRARKIRKVMGGGMRQSGLLAAAGIFALQNHVNRLADDHKHSKILAHELTNLNWVKRVLPCETNIVIFEVESSARVANELAKEGIKVQPFSPVLVRMVTHLDVTVEMIDYTVEKLKRLKID